MKIQGPVQGSVKALSKALLKALSKAHPRPCPEFGSEGGEGSKGTATLGFRVPTTCGNKKFD